MQNDRASRDQMLTELCSLAQTGDKAAYGKLLAEIESILRGYLQHRVSANDTIDDIIQEILISVHHGLHTFIPGRKFSSWMFAIARNRLCDYLRASKRRSVEIATESERLDEFVFEPESTRSVDETYSMLIAELDHIPMRYANAVRATKIEGHSIREASKALGMSESALKVTIHRAYKLLRQRVRFDTGG